MKNSIINMTMHLLSFIAFLNATAQNNTYPWPSSGSIGIGTTTPNQFLTVTGGNINVDNTSTGYMIGNNMVLWYKSDPTNIFVGVGTGTNNTGYRNTFVGNNAGMSNISGSGNTFIGFNSGINNIAGYGNTFTGIYAGLSNNGSLNTFTGLSAGKNNDIGYSNCFYGKSAGYNNTSGYENTFMGNYCGYENNDGNQNTYIGFHSGRNYSGNFNTYLGVKSGYSSSGSYNAFGGTETGSLNQGNFNAFWGSNAGRYHTTGNNNTYIGYNAQGTNSYTTLNNSAAIGANAIVTDNDKMILGDNNVNVGIGLSDITPAPQNKLEINTGNTYSTGNPGNGTGFSGLRFRDLTANSDPYITNPGKGVLSVDGSGDVIYVPRTYNCWDKDQDDFCDDLPLSNPNNEDINNDNVCDYRDCQAAAGDHDWYKVGTTTPPNSIFDVMYNRGRAGIGTTTPLGTTFPIYKLHLNNSIAFGPAPMVRMVFTTQGGGPMGGGTGIGSLDGFQIGVNSGNNMEADLIQMEDRDMRFFTNKLQRVVIKRDGKVGINDATPANRVEITSVMGDPTLSGLRFTNLKSTTLPDPSNGKVLTVNGDGDVILVEDQTGGVGGADYDWFLNTGGLPTTNNNTNDQIYHLGQSAVGDNVYFATATTNFPALDVQMNAIMKGKGLAGNFEKLGTSDFNIGVRGFADNNDVNFFTAGVLGEVTSSEKIGVWGGFFIGPVGTTSSLTLQMNQQAPSDTILKSNIQPFIRGLDVIKNVKPISFQYNGKARFDSTSRQVGVNAQEILSFAPYAVDTFYLPLETGDTFTSPLLGVRVNALVYTSINAIKELDSAVTPLTTLPPAPTLVSPANGFTGDFCSPRSITGGLLVWNSVPGNFIFYTVQISKDSSFTTDIITYSSLSGTKGDTVVFAGVCDTTTWYWRVNAKNIAGTGPWSEVRYFVNTGYRSPVSPGGNLSDSLLKDNVTPITNALENVMQLRGINFTWDTLHHTWLPSGNQLGMVAQEVKPIYPEVVFTDDSGFYHVDYQRLVPVLVEAMKQQQATIDSLRTALANQQQSSPDSQITAIQQQLVLIQACIDNLPPGMGCGGSAKMGAPVDDNANGNGGELNYELSSPRAILYQNQPNPFGDGTVIRFFIPVQASNAQMAFYDEFGRELKVIDVSVRGNGIVNLTTENLAAGVYTYSLIVNGEVVETMKMMRSK